MRGTILTICAMFTLAGCQSPTDSAAPPATDLLATSVITQDAAVRADETWGTFYTYSDLDTFGTRQSLAGVAVILPGLEIHPPHVHPEEEYLMVLEGSGTWHVKEDSFPAKAGDLLYAAPWESHGITNTGDVPLKFVVWKWTSAGLRVPKAPAEPLE